MTTTPHQATIPTITETAALTAFCAKAATAQYVTVDTEFLRERSYYSLLCLVQLAYPGDGETDAVLVDPLAKGLSLDPLYALFRNPDVVKVFHAARQDLEIFHHEAQVFPEPLFDTQIAAMVCGFGDQVGYETLVKRFAGARLDKSSRITDWSRRPLSAAQKSYALADVTHLRAVYEALSAQLERSGRAIWLQEELQALTSPETYRVRPEDAWLRVKIRSHSPRFLALVQALAAFRESHAQGHNIPRNRVFKDDALTELAGFKPQSHEDLGRSRLLLRDARKGAIAEGILDAVAQALAISEADLPRPERNRDKRQVNPALADLLRVLLKAQSDREGVAARLIASTGDLDAIAAGIRDVPALHGWRRDVFGASALQLCDGRAGLAVEGQKVQIVPLG